MYPVNEQRIRDVLYIAVQLAGTRRAAVLATFVVRARRRPDAVLVGERLMRRNADLAMHS